MEYKNIWIEGPNGIIRTSSKGVKDTGIPEGVTYLGCIRDNPADRVLPIRFSHPKMDTEVRYYADNWLCRVNPRGILR